MKRIIVMGGSFNPPTIAHFKLMQAALDRLTENGCACNGIFIPSSDAYVKRKNARLIDRRDTLPESLRLAMLQSFMQYDQRMTIDDRELGTTSMRGHTLQTLQEIQARNPDSEIYFIFGGDKIKDLARWEPFTTLISQFHIIAFDRDQEDLNAVILSDTQLCQHRDRFILLGQPDGLEGISSSVVWQKLLSGKNTADMLTHDVYTMLLAYRKAMVNTILCFQGENHFLSNFHTCLLWWRGLPYANAEAAFQSAKCSIESDRARFCYLSAIEAKRKGQKVTLPANWEQSKETIMEEIVHQKFFQSPSLARKLMATGNTELIEGNTWGDTCWGIDLHTMKGQNKLGRILMKVRDELLDIPPDKFDSRVKPRFVDASSNDHI